MCLALVKESGEHGITAGEIFSLGIKGSNGKAMLKPSITGTLNFLETKDELIDRLGDTRVWSETGKPRDVYRMRSGEPTGSHRPPPPLLGMSDTGLGGLRRNWEKIKPLLSPEEALGVGMALRYIRDLNLWRRGLIKEATQPD